MKIPGRSKLRRSLHKLQKRFAPKALILMYHRVGEVDIDPWALCVTPENFAEHLEVLQKDYHPLSLTELVKAHQGGKLPNRSVAITFDDGYADNLHQAKPLLNRYGIPATVFVSTGYLGQQREFWWDELERLVLAPGQLPEKLSLKINGKTHELELGTARNYTQQDYKGDRTAKAHKSIPGSRMFFYYELWQLLRPLPENERLQALEDIRIWADAKPTARHSHRSLLPEEVSLLGDGELVEIGAHTVTHPFLSEQPTALQADEIQGSKTQLEEMLNRPVTTFSYPFGNYTTETVELARNAGFSCACSTVEDTVWTQSQRFQLPRFGAENWNGEEFAKQLSRWFHG
ncbi:polysaccharide deacetylase [Crinalium epipsammum PCC 9333]|uniref:Polysaccharide deacetylase n=1 Tax=Crinalium epipsammum PCC 9333 TaxID=1173022 RepID=K9VZS9_9CYAN|nr:polysaccharide deacetylase family protein [Crinalium epipsammum]AFZ13623.1 polysaccharide deacetylase [Crinalium epipsammum PCC 9333]